MEKLKLQMNRYLKKLKESKNQSKIKSCGIKVSLNLLEGNNKFLIIQLWRISGRILIQEKDTITITGLSMRLNNN